MYMNPQPEVIALSILQAGALTALLLLFPLTLITLFACRKKKRLHTDSEPDWSVPSMSGYSGRTRFFHTWDPRVKTVVLLGFCFVIVSFTRLDTAVYALLICSLSAILCGTPPKRLWSRLAAVSGFTTMLMLILPFTVQGVPEETLLVFPFAEKFPFHSSGFFLGLLIACKACAIALLMEPMLGTAPIAVTLEAIQRLGIPSSITQMILLTYRYSFVFLEECRRMYRAMRVRGFNPGTNMLTIRTMGNFFGMLFIRSYIRTQQVYEAMLSRGYNGSLPSYTRFQARPGDTVKGVIWVLTGLALLVHDRFPLQGILNN